MPHHPDPHRYSTMKYARCGRSGIQLPRISLGLWNNFGANVPFDSVKEMVLRAFDLGITHFDLANNYGPPPGSAETNFGHILASDLRDHRDELLIATKAGHLMWPGPYGDFGSRKHLAASLDQSLRRLGVDYVDIFYSHRPDPQTPIEETMGALDAAVRSGKALYVGLSAYKPEQARKALQVLAELGTPCLIHQPYYHMFCRDIEGGLLEVLEENGVGSIAFCPLGQGLLTNKYLDGIPEGSRLAKKVGFIKESEVSQANVASLRKLNAMAADRGQSLAQMALAWVLRSGRVTSALIGASRVGQIEENVRALENLEFSVQELASIEALLAPVEFTGV